MKKYLALLLALCMLLALLVGCSGETESAADPAEETSEIVSDTQEAASTETDAAENVDAPADADVEDTVPAAESALPADYPMIAPDGMVMTAFATMNPNLSEAISDYGQLPWWEELAERTGISFEWTMASFATASEQFNLLVAADNLPNLNTSTFYSYGISYAVENDIFVDLAPYLDEYAPDYKVVTMQSHVRPVVYDENGSIVSFIEVGKKEFAPNSGVLIRGDLLEEQGLDVPVTYDQYEDTMLKLKDAYDLDSVIYTYTDNSIWLSSGKGVKNDFSIDANGDVVFGPVEDAFREYLQTMNRWFDEGILYEDFYAIPDGQWLNLMVSQMSSGANVCNFTYCEFASMIQLDEGQKLVAGYIPRDNEDDEVHLTEGVDSVVHGNDYYIGFNSTEEEIQALCMMMNYFYTEEGALFANYGVEGQSFEYQDDGTPWYTDLILNNSDDLTQTQTLVFYIGYGVPCSADFTKYNVSSLTRWADFIDVWSSADNVWTMPQISLTTEETEEYTRYRADIDTYMDETIVKFIIGDLDPNNDADWNSYIECMDGLGIQVILDIYQTALDRYNNV